MVKFAQTTALLAGVAFSALSATPIAAQGSAQAPQGQSPTQTPTPAQTQAQTESGEPDIIVTAQRRAERLQDVPIVVTAFTAERLEEMNVTKPQDLHGTAPSLVVGSQGQAVRDVQSFSIRGQATGFLASPSVAVYIAEVPVPSSISLNLQGAPGMFVDLENVQILSGPQGTLFGRNTTGGAVLFTPRKPSNNFEGYVEGAIGNYDLRGLEGAINVPIINDVLAVRATLAYQDRRGYTKDLIWNKWRDDVHWLSGRVGLLFTPSERFENYLMAYGAKSSTNGSGQIHRGWNYDVLVGVGFCVDPPICSAYRDATDTADSDGPRRTRHGLDDYAKIQTWGIINTTSYKLNDELTLKNIISFQKLRDDYATDQDGTPIQQYDPAVQDTDVAPGYFNGDPSWNFPQDSLKQFTEELQLQGEMLDKKLNFTIGAFYLNAKPDRLWGGRSLNFCPAAFTGFCGPGEAYSGVTSKSRAVYAQGTLDLGVLTPALDRLRLTGGIRYTWDTVEGFTYSFRPDPFVPGNVVCDVNGDSVPRSDAPNPADFDGGFDPGAGCRFEAKLKSKAPTWTLGLDYRPMDDLLLYAKYSRGYKSGGFNSFAVRPETMVFLPEKVDSYEVGFKSDWRLGTVPFRFNATYYFTNYSNIQRPAGDFNAGAIGAQVLAAKAHIQGIEVETSIRPAKWLEIGAMVSHTDGDYTKFKQEILSPAGQYACNGFVPMGGIADYSCNELQFVAPWIYNIRATVDLPIPERLGELSLFVNYSNISHQNTSPLTPGSLEDINGVPVEPGVRLKGYGLLNASLTWRNISGSGFDASIFGTNLTNKLYRVGNSGVFQSLATWSTLYGEPRMYGLKLAYRFGK